MVNFIIVGDVGVTKLCEVVDETTVADRVKEIQNTGMPNFKVYRIDEEIDIKVAYPYFFGETTREDVRKVGERLISYRNEDEEWKLKTLKDGLKLKNHLIMLQKLGRR